MILADVVTWFLIVVGSYLLLICYWLSAYALFPGVVRASADRYALRPVASTLVGLAVLTPLLVIGLGLGNAIGRPGPAGVLRVAVMLTVLPALLGSAGLVLRIGSGLPSDRDDAQPWRRVLRGGIVLAPTFLLPFVGWFVVLPWTLISGFGTVVMGLSTRRTARAETSAARQAAPPTS